MPNQKLAELIAELEKRTNVEADRMRQGDTIASRRLRALQSAENAIESLPASAQKTILLNLLEYFVTLEEEIEFWSG